MPSPVVNIKYIEPVSSHNNPMMWVLLLSHFTGITDEEILVHTGYITPNKWLRRELYSQSLYA